MDVLRYVAFTTDPSGGNPAGVVLDATGIDDATMLKTAADIGYSETAFVVPRDDGSLDTRYFSPLAEVPFCGHATIATAVAHAQRHGVGTLRLRTKAGEVTVSTAQAEDGSMTATLVSVAPRSIPSPTPTWRSCWRPCAGPPRTSTRRCRPAWPTPAPGTR